MPPDDGTQGRRSKPKPTRRPLPPSDFDEQASTFEPTPSRPPAHPSRGPRPSSSRKDADGPDGRRARTESGGPNWLERIVFGSVGSVHLATFCRQFAQYQDAGVDLLKSLAALERQFQRTALGPVLGRMRQAVRRGESLSDAMAREPRAFDRLALSMVRVAEARGAMPEVLRQLADHYESRVRMLRNARSAMIYPVAVLAIAGGVVYLLTVFVLPGMIEMMTDNPRARQMSLPLPTRILMGISSFMRTIGWWLVPLLLAGGVFGLVRAYRVGFGKALMDEAALRMPVLGALLRKIDVARLARTLSTLLDAGVDYDASMRLTAGVLYAAPHRRAVERARRLVVGGTELSEALAGSRRFGIDVIEVLSTGEATGKLPETLEHLADDYEEQVERMVANLGHLIQPVLTLVLGGIVFFIVLAFVMAYIAMLSSAPIL